jgi:hypothetical protein
MREERHTFVYIAPYNFESAIRDREAMMILHEIVRTCSNEHIARAAVCSIGGDFARTFAHTASSRNMSTGVFAARLVKDFSIKASDEDWDDVDGAIRGADQPILQGLRYILGQSLRDDADEAKGAGVLAPLNRRRGAGHPRVHCI